jgi:hypothetical protein
MIYLAFPCSIPGILYKNMRTLSVHPGIVSRKKKIKSGDQVPKRPSPGVPGFPGLRVPAEKNSGNRLRPAVEYHIVIT